MADNPIMKTLTIDDTTYEVYDEVARQQSTFFLVTVRENGDGYIADYTAEEIFQAVSSGRTVFVTQEDTYALIPLVLFSDAMCVFVGCSGEGIVQCMVDHDRNVVMKASLLPTEEQLEEKLGVAELPTAINTALAQAKASGEFNGANGKTPVKGTDYFTESDKTELVSAVIAALPDASGVSY